MQKVLGIFISMFLLVSCASPAPQPTATPLPSPTSTAAPTATELPEPTPTTPASGEAGEQTQEIANILTTLDLDEKDHESYTDANYRIETREWMGQQVEMLIHDDLRIEGERIDAMKVEINGVEQWVRGAYYPVEGYGGMAIDVIVHPLQEKRAFFSTPEGAQAVHGELLTAIAHQKGMSEQGLADYLANNNNKIEIVLPQFWNPDNRSKNRSPSYLRASEPQIVDLSQPVVYASRTGSYINQEVAPGVTVPDGIRWVVGQSDAGIAVFVANEQLFIVYESDNNMTSDRAGSIASRLFAAFDAVAEMQSGFVDTQGEGRSFLEKQTDLSGKDYVDGNTVVDREVFWRTNVDYTEYEFTAFELK